MSRVVSSYVADNSNHDSNIGVESHSIISIFQMYRVFSKARNAVGPSKSLIFWTFPGVLGFFRPFDMGDFSFWYFWDI